MQLDLRALTGLRVLLTAWVIVFHTLFFSVMFTERQEWLTWYYQPWTLFLRNGLTAVDVFFLITGFLLSYSVFKKSHPAMSDETQKVPGFSWRQFVWRRVSRVYPTYLFCMGVVAFGVYRVRSICSMDLIPESHVGIKALMNMTATQEDEVITEYPTAVHLFPFNLLFLNNFLPFGGFMGWTWSLVQFCLPPLLLQLLLLQLT